MCHDNGLAVYHVTLLSSSSTWTGGTARARVSSKKEAEESQVHKMLFHELYQTFLYNYIYAILLSLEKFCNHFVWSINT